METFFSYKGQNVYYSKTGTSALPVMLVHGFAEDGNVWDEQVAFLQNQTQLIVPHLPGSGGSGYNPQLSAVEDYAECLYALLQRENITSCIMLGHSMGGYITLAFAEKYAHCLKGFGFVHSTAFADNDEKKQNRLKGIAMMEEYGAQAFIKTAAPNLFSSTYKKNFPSKVDGMVVKGANFKKEALQQYYHAMMLRPDRTNVLRNTQLPVLFIAGTEDVAVPLADVLQQVSLPKISFIHILQNTGHIGMWEKAGQVNHFIWQFVQYIANR